MGWSFSGDGLEGGVDERAQGDHRLVWNTSIGAVPFEDWEVGY